MQAPWYYNATAATLKHQRIQEENQKQFNKLGDWYKKGVKDVSFCFCLLGGTCLILRLVFIYVKYLVNIHVLSF